MTPIRETIARAIFEARWPGHWNDPDFLLQRDQVYDEADAVLRALDEAGLVVVPREASEAMRVAGYKLVGQTHYEPMASAQGWGEHAADIYRAMIAASVVE